MRAGRVRLKGERVVPAAHEATPDVAALESRLGVRFQHAGLLLTALTHPSYANEHPEDAPETNERLEFLGDAALGLVVAELLFARYPEEGEGRLTEWRAQLVMGPTLAGVARDLGVGEALLLGRGEASSGGHERDGNLERAYEALIGALLLDAGLPAVREFVERTLRGEIEALQQADAVLNAKGELQELLQGHASRPDYVTIAAEGPEHDRRFTVEVRIDGEPLGAASAASKQGAEKAAALLALCVLRQRARHEQPLGA